VVGFAKDPNIAFVLSNVGLDKAVIYEYDVAARKQKEILFKHRFFSTRTTSSSAATRAAATSLSGMCSA
jgi:hypothetical protein